MSDTTTPDSSVSAHFFRVRLLGPLSLYRDDVQIDANAWQQRARSLFALLATAPEHRRQRDDVIDALWPEASPESAGGNLRFTLYLLRRHLAPSNVPTVISHRQVLALNPACCWEIDCDRFDVLSRGDTMTALEEAAALYRGEPLIDFRYEDWAQPIQDSLRTTWRTLCYRLSSLAWERGAPQQAVGWLERVLAADPLDEETLQHLLRRLIALGRRAEARRRYREFAAHMRQDLGVAPMLETASLVDELEMSDQRLAPGVKDLANASRMEFAPVVPRYPLSTAVRLLGRDAELATVMTHLIAPQRPAPIIVLVTAEAGMGKTRLLSELAQRARMQGALTLAGSAYEEEGRLPYGPVHDALLDFMQIQPREVLQDQLGDLLPDLGKLIPELHAVHRDSQREDVDRETQRLRLFSAVAEAIERITAASPLLLLLDDLQWADEATLQLLHYLLRQPRSAGLVVVATYREEEMRENVALAGIAREQGSYIHLGPLTEPDIALLLEERLGGHCAPTLLRALYEGSDGNPFFVLEIAQLLREEGRLEWSDEGWRLLGRAIDVPPAVRETVVRRLRRLGPDEREVLTLGAVLGREFAYAPLTSMWQGGERDLFDALEAAVMARVVAETEEGYTFRHPILWDAVYHRAPVPRRAVLHERAALALEHVYGSRAEEHAAELAYHFVAAGRIRLARAFHYSILAGDQAERAFAHREAERHYRVAVETAGKLGDAKRKADALGKLGNALSAMARLDESITALDEATHLYESLGDPEEEARAAAQMALTYWFAHLRHRSSDLLSMEAGLERLRAILARLEHVNPGAPSPGLAQLYAALPRVLGALGRDEEELVAAQRAVVVGRTIGDPSIEVAGHLRRGFALRKMGQQDEALSALLETAQQAEMIGDLFTLVAACSQAAGIFCQRGELRSALLYDDRSFQAAERRGGLDQLIGGGGFEAAVDSASATGDWDQALRYCERVQTLYRSLRPDDDDPRPWLWRAELSLRGGDMEATERHLARAAVVAERIGDALTLQDIEALLAERDLLLGRPESALQRLQPFGEQRNEGVSSMSLQMLHGWAHAELGHEVEAQKFAESALTRAAAMRSAPRVANATYGWGLVLSRLGRVEEAEQALEKAASIAHPMPYPYTEACALYELGVTLVWSEKMERAQQQLRAALALFQRLGARIYVERTENALSSYFPT